MMSATAAADAVLLILRHGSQIVLLELPCARWRIDEREEPTLRHLFLVHKKRVVLFHESKNKSPLQTC